MKISIVYILYLFLPALAFAKTDSKWIKLGSSHNSAYDYHLSKDGNYYVMQSNGFTNFINLDKGDLEFNWKFIGTLFVDSQSNYVNLFRDKVNIRSSNDGEIIRTFPLVYNNLSFLPDVLGDLGKPDNYITDYSKELNLLVIIGTWENNSDNILMSLWDVSKGEYRGKLNYMAEGVKCLKFIPNTNNLIIASSSELFIVDIQTGQKLNVVSSKDAKNITLSEDKQYISYVERTGKYIQGYGYEHRCIVRRVSNLEKVTEFVAYQFTYPFPFSPDNNSVAIISQDQRFAEIRNIHDDNVIDRIELPIFSIITSVMFDKIGNNLIFSEGHSGTSWKYNLGTKEWKTLTGANFRPDLLQYSPDGKFIITANKDKFIVIFDTLGNVINRIKVECEKNISFHKGQLHLNTDNSKIVYCNEEENRFQIYDVDPKSDFYMSTQESDLVKDVGFSPDGKRIAAALEKTGVKLYDAENFSLITSIKLKENYEIKRMVYFSDKLIYALTSDHLNQNSSLLKWNVETNKVEYLYSELLNYYNSSIFVSNSHNKYILAYGVIINLENESIEEAPYSPNGAYSMDITKDGSYITIVPDGTGMYYDEFFFHTWKLPENIISGKYDFYEETNYSGMYDRIFQNDVRFSPNGGSLASCSSEGDIILWNLKDTILSTQDISSGKKSITVFPMPATNTITILNDQDFRSVRIELYNLLGEKVKEWSAENLVNFEKVQELNISEIANGNYMLRLIGHNNDDKQIIIIKK